MRLLRLAWVPLAIALVSACGPSPARAPGGEGAEVGLVVVVILPTPEKLPFDPRGARLRAATAELGRIVGHPVTFVIDAGLAAEGRASFEGQLIEAIEQVAKDLVLLGKRQPAAFAYGAPLLGKIVCKYRAVTTKAESSLDPAQRTLTVIEGARAYALVEPGLIYGALRDSYEGVAESRYSSISPRDVPAAERRAYFEFMTSDRATRGDTEALEDKHSLAIIKLIELARLVGTSDPELADDLRRNLLLQRSHFTTGYVHHPEDAQSLAPAFHAAERAWTEWLTAGLPAMNAEQKVQVLRDVFVRGLNGKGYLPFAFPGFDKVGMSLSVIDAWIAAGHPDTVAARTPENALFEYVLCPHPKDARGHRTTSPRCDYHLYRFAVENPLAQKRFTDAVLSRKDAAFTEAAFAAIVHGDGGLGPFDRYLVLSRAVEADEATWTIGVRVLAEIADTSGPRLVDEVRRLWAAYPSRRAALLTVLAEADPYDNGKVDWAGFEHDFGSKLDEAQLAAALDFSPNTVGRLPTMWPALGAGWSRAQAIVPRLDRFLDLVATQNDPQRPYTTLRSLFNLMCAEPSGAADVAQLRTYLEGRVRAHPGDPLVSLESEASCRGRSRPEHAASRPRPPRAPQTTRPRARGNQ